MVQIDCTSYDREKQGAEKKRTVEEENYPLRGAGEV